MRVLVRLAAAVVLIACEADHETKRQEKEPLSDEIFAITAAHQIADGVPMEFVWINPGRFTMGSPSHPLENGRDSDEYQTVVTLSQGFYLGKYEVTQKQWEAVMETKPWLGHRRGKHSRVQDNSDHPAVYISWEDVQVFIERLNKAVGEDLYRLPTEDAVGQSAMGAYPPTSILALACALLGPISALPRGGESVNPTSGCSTCC